MKKTKNLLTLAIVAILGLSFCGVFVGKANADTYKQTTIKYTFDDGESGYSFDREQVVSANAVSLSCVNHMMYIVTDNFSKRKESFQLSVLSKNTDFCEGKWNGIVQQFHDKGVEIVKALAWVEFSPYQSPSGTKNYQLVKADYGDKPVAEVVCGKNTGNVYIVVGPSLYYSFSARTCEKKDVEKQLQDQGFTIGWWKNTGPDLNKWPSELVQKEVYPDWYTVPSDPSTPTNPTNPTNPTDPADPEVPGTSDPGNNGGTNWNYNNASDEASILTNCSHAGKREVNGEWVQIEGEEGAGIRCIIELVIDVMTVGVGILGVIGITVVGIQYLTSGGNDEKAKKAKRRLLEVVVGIILYVIAYAVLKWLLPSMK